MIDKSDWTLTTVRLPPDQHAFIREQSHAYSITKASVVNVAIADLMVKDEGALRALLGGAPAFIGLPGPRRIHSRELDELIIDAARRGLSQRAICHAFGFSHAALSLWLGHGMHQRKRREPFASRFEAAREAARQERNRS